MAVDLYYLSLLLYVSLFFSEHLCLGKPVFLWRSCVGLPIVFCPSVYISVWFSLLSWLWVCVPFCCSVGMSISVGLSVSFRWSGLFSPPADVRRPKSISSTKCLFVFVLGSCLSLLLLRLWESDTDSGNWSYNFSWLKNNNLHMMLVTMIKTNTHCQTFRNDRRESGKASGFNNKTH